jgi:hypothetical protein
VLNDLSEQVRECLEHADDCARKAAAQTDPKIKQDFLDLEQRWLSLARSYEFTNRLGRSSPKYRRLTTTTKDRVAGVCVTLVCDGIGTMKCISRNSI